MRSRRLPFSVLSSSASSRPVSVIMLCCCSFCLCVLRVLPLGVLLLCALQNVKQNTRKLWHNPELGELCASMLQHRRVALDGVNRSIYVVALCRPRELRCIRNSLRHEVGALANSNLALRSSFRAPSFDVPVDTDGKAEQQAQQAPRSWAEHFTLLSLPRWMWPPPTLRSAPIWVRLPIRLGESPSQSAACICRGPTSS